MSRERPTDQQPDESALSALYQRSRREQPSAALDQAVMQEARRALSRRRLRWWLPLSTAAVILLGVSLTLNQMEPPGHTAPTLDSRREPVPASAVPDLSEEASSEQPSTVQTPSVQGVPEKLMKSAPPPGLQRAAPAKRSAEADGMLFDAPLELEQAPAVQTDNVGLAESPEAQVTGMLDLLQQADTQELREHLGERLRAFRASYPDYPLPDALERFEATLP